MTPETIGPRMIALPCPAKPKDTDCICKIYTDCRLANSSLNNRISLPKGIKIFADVQSFKVMPCSLKQL
jgi:hypothetical protein